MISRKTYYVSTDGWRGYSVPIFAVAGINDTGSWEDSPCPTSIVKKETKALGSLLRKAKIKFRIQTCETSNVFCVHHYFVVAAEDVQRAREIVVDYLDKNPTELLYPVAEKKVTEQNNNRKRITSFLTNPAS